MTAAGCVGVDLDEVAAAVVSTVGRHVAGHDAEQGAALHRAARSLVELWLLGRGGSGAEHPARLPAEAEVVEMQRPQAALLLMCAHRTVPTAPSASVVRSLAARLGAGEMAAPTQTKTHAALLLERAGTRGWPEALRRLAPPLAAAGVVVLATEPSATHNNLRTEYQAARALLPVALRVARGRTVVPLRELRLHRLLAGVDADTRQRFVTEVAGRLPALPARRRERLLDTLDALRLHRHHVQGAARALGVDPRTVRNRAAQIRELTGLAVDADELRVLPYLLVLAETGQGSPQANLPLAETTAAGPDQSGKNRATAADSPFTRRSASATIAPKSPTIVGAEGLGSRRKGS